MCNLLLIKWNWSRILFKYVRATAVSSIPQSSITVSEAVMCQTRVWEVPGSNSGLGRSALNGVPHLPDECRDDI